VTTPLLTTPLPITTPFQPVIRATTAAPQARNASPKSRSVRTLTPRIQSRGGSAGPGHGKVPVPVSHDAASPRAVHVYHFNPLASMRASPPNLLWRRGRDSFSRTLQEGTVPKLWLAGEGSVEPGDGVGGGFESGRGAPCSEGPGNATLEGEGGGGRRAAQLFESCLHVRRDTFGASLAGLLGVGEGEGGHLLVTGARVKAHQDGMARVTNSSPRTSRLSSAGRAESLAAVVSDRRRAGAGGGERNQVREGVEASRSCHRTSSGGTVAPW